MGNSVLILISIIMALNALNHLVQTTQASLEEISVNPVGNMYEAAMVLKDPSTGFEETAVAEARSKTAAIKEAKMLLWESFQRATGRLDPASEAAVNGIARFQQRISERNGTYTATQSCEGEWHYVTVNSLVDHKIIQTSLLGRDLMATMEQCFLNAANAI